MNEKHYFPEGTLIKTELNKTYLSSMSALEEAKNNGRILEAMVTLCDSGFELCVDLGACKGVIPREEVAWSEDGRIPRDIAVITRVGKPVSFVVDRITVDGDGEPIAYLSRRKAQEQCISNYLNYLEIGDIIDAKITHFEPFGAFCDIGCGVISLLSIDSISVSRISHPADRFKIGETIRAAVKSREEPLDTKNNISNGRIALTHKELMGTWEENAERFSVGQTVAGIVRSVENYGIFVELAPNLAGLAEWKSGVEVGQIASVYIKNIIPAKKKVKLVIVDSCNADKNFMKNDYYVTEGNVADWIY